MDWWEQVKAFCCSLAGMDFVDESSANGNDWLRTAPARPPAQAGKMRARRMWPFGIRARPPQGVEATWVAPMGAASNRIYVAGESNSYGPLDLKDGEVCIYNAKDAGSVVCRIKLDADGHITVIPSAGAKVKLGDGTDANLDQLVTKADMQGVVNTIVDAFNSHKHIGVQPGAGVSGISDTVILANITIAGSPNVLAKKP